MKTFSVILVILVHVMIGHYANCTTGIVNDLVGDLACALRCLGAHERCVITDGKAECYCDAPYQYSGVPRTCSLNCDFDFDCYDGYSCENHICTNSQNATHQLQLCTTESSCACNTATGFCVGSTISCESGECPNICEQTSGFCLAGKGQECDYARCGKGLFCTLEAGIAVCVGNIQTQVLMTNNLQNFDFSQESTVDARDPFVRSTFEFFMHDCEGKCTGPNEYCANDYNGDTKCYCQIPFMYSGTPPTCNLNCKTDTDCYDTYRCENGRCIWACLRECTYKNPFGGYTKCEPYNHKAHCTVYAR